MKQEVFVISFLLLCLGVFYVESRQCYECSVDQNPMKSDCWNQTDKEGAVGVTIVECESACYSRTFQSGGDYWFVYKGCSDKLEDGCAASDNCKGPNWGPCMKCCKDDLCNVEAPGSGVMVMASVVLSLTAAILAKML